uniref:Uncharacterized protein n=2 Tax=Kalanchoe fedtschenkoi TaxID=63787 RepID=A0A7N0SXA4_KALFE
MEEEAHAHCCDLEVDVNGEETFMVNKKIVSVFSNKLSKLFGKAASNPRNLKLVFNDFPGGAWSFELVARFCYSNGEAKITPFNVCLLYAAARYMEMDKPVAGARNLLEQAEKFVEEINCWTWSELMAALKQCQDTCMYDGPLSILVGKCVDSLVGRLVLASEASPCASTSSPDSSGFRLSCDSKSTESMKNSLTRVTWWFEDLLFMEPSLLQMVVKTMIAHKLDHALISKFLFFYQKTKFATSTSGEKQELIKTLIDILFLLDLKAVSSKSLFSILQISISLNVDKSSRAVIESMIGSQLDKATLDNLLVPAPSGTNCLYDVNLVLRLLKAFLLRSDSLPSPTQIKRVVSLMDVYITEVAPDPSLKPSKYIALVTALPDSARESHDAIYHAIDLYLQVHSSFSGEEKLKLCSAIKHEKLSAQAFDHLTENKRFPSRSGIPACKSKLEKVGITKADPAVDPPCSVVDKSRGEKKEACDQVVAYDGELDVHKDNERLREHLKGMQCRVVELERACKKMQNQMAKMMRSRSSTSRNGMSLPKLCS